MARPLRLEVAGGIHHVAARANAGGMLFRDDIDRKQFLTCLAKAIRHRGWFVLSYCLMGTHYHLLVETPRANLAQGIRDLNGSFARYWHDRHQSHGHVFGGRYFSRLVQRDAHLLQTARYIVRNPVDAGLCSHPAQWRWSSYRAASAGSASPILHTDRLLWFFEAEGGDPREGYRRFVDIEEPAPDRMDDVGVLGDAAFARGHIPDPISSSSIPRRFSTPRRPPLELVLASAPRDEAAAAAHLRHGYLLKEIGAALGVHSSTVGRWIRARDWT